MFLSIHAWLSTRLNSISSPLLPMIGTSKPSSSIRKETPRTIPSSTPKEAISSQDVLPSGLFSTGCPIRTPSSITKAGTIEAVAEKLFTLPITKCGVQAATVERRRSSELEARSTGSHCGGLTTAWSTSASLLARQGFVVFGMKAAQKAAATPMRTSARKREVCFFAYKLRSGGGGAWRMAACMGFRTGPSLPRRWEPARCAYRSGG